jgi:excisionase family DNA binding protein
MMFNEPLKINADTTMTKTCLVDRDTAAKFLGVKKNTLAEWAVNNKYPLPYVKIGRLVRYRMSDLEAFLERNLKHKI